MACSYSSGSGPSAFRQSPAARADAGTQARDPHWWRHSAATRMLRDGVPIEVVSTLPGHSSVTTTSAIYGHLTAEDARRALEAAGWFSITGTEVTW